MNKPVNYNRCMSPLDRFTVFFPSTKVFKSKAKVKVLVGDQYIALALALTLSFKCLNVSNLK